MRQLMVAACLGLSVVSAVSAQGLLPKSVVQHATVIGTASAGFAARGSTVTLWADVTPHPSVHVYAEGARDFTAVALKATPNPSLTMGKAQYPKPDVGGRGLDDPPAYAVAFRIGLPVSINSNAKPGEVLTVAGVLTYQACDERMCYPVTSAPVNWTLTVK